MSDKVASVVAIAPVAASGRVNAFVQPGSGSSDQQTKGEAQTPQLQNTRQLEDVVTLQSATSEQGPPAAESVASPSASQSAAQSALVAAETHAAAKAQAQSEQQKQQSLQAAAQTLSSYFSDMHPDVNFRVEQQASGMVVLMVNSLDGKVLQTIGGDEAKQLASSLFGSASLPQTA